MATSKAGKVILKMLDPNNAVTAFKAVAASVVASLIVLIPTLVLSLLSVPEIAQMIINIFVFALAILVWGYLLRRFWGWK